MKVSNILHYYYNVKLCRLEPGIYFTFLYTFYVERKNFNFIIYDIIIIVLYFIWYLYIYISIESIFYLYYII